MRKLLKSLIIILIVTFPLSINVKAEEVTYKGITTENAAAEGVPTKNVTQKDVTGENITNINDLIEKAKELDGQEVTIQGEAIGEDLERGNYSWVNVNDSTNVIGVWLDNNDALSISNYGDYNTKGDTVQITGVFHRACKEHGGEADFHSKSIKIVKNGQLVKDQISSTKILSAAVLSVFALIMLGISVKVILKKY